MTELKPCPFCGRAPVIEDCGTNRYFIRCKCGIAQDKLYAQRCDAIRRWNTRKTSAQPEQRWIPVSERLPDDNRQVLVFARSSHFALAKYDEMREADGTYSKQWVTFDAWKPFYKIKDVIEWMPLPAPYVVR